MVRLVVVISSVIVGAYVLLFSGGYMQDTCETVMPYRIASIDQGFGIDKKEAEQAIREAVAAWEEAAGLDLFVYEAESDKALLVNFIYDERQRETVAEQEARIQLENKKNKVESSEQSYGELAQKIDILEDELDRMVKQYENDVEQYNRDIENKAMSYTEARARERAIDKKFAHIRLQEETLNRTIVSINSIAEMSQQEVKSYNSLVENYNTEFAGTSSFDQGDYTSDGVINIYQYENHRDLVAVLAHELGHALGIDHVDDAGAVMNAVLEEQDFSQEIISKKDLEALSHVCSLL